MYCSKKGRAQYHVCFKELIDLLYPRKCCRHRQIVESSLIKLVQVMDGFLVCCPVRSYGSYTPVNETFFFSDQIYIYVVAKILETW